MATMSHDISGDAVTGRRDPLSRNSEAWLTQSRDSPSPAKKRTTSPSSLIS